MVQVMPWLLVVFNRCICKGTHFFTFLYFACFCMTIVRGMHYPCGCAIISHASCLLLHIFFEFFGHYSSAAYIQSIDSLNNIMPQHDKLLVVYHIQLIVDLVRFATVVMHFIFRWLLYNSVIDISVIASFCMMSKHIDLTECLIFIYISFLLYLR